MIVHTSIDSDDENDASLPPPRKILRRGTPELEQALQAGEVHLSLPRQELESWMGRSSPIVETDSREIPSGRQVKVAEEKEESSSTPQYHDPQQQKEDAISIRFSDIIGHGAVKLRLEEVLLRIALPQHLADSILTGIRSSTSSILMFGPPGCGKTQLAKAVAGEASAAFLSVKPSDILSKFVGESEASIRNLFKRANDLAKTKESKCTVLFFDEIDALGLSRGGGRSDSMEQSGADGCSRRILAELLIQLNKINSHSVDESDEEYSPKDKMGADALVDDDEAGDSSTSSLLSENDMEANNSDTNSVDTVYDETFSSPKRRARIIVVAATNRPEDCDPALIRRFAVRVIVGLPSLKDRSKIISRYLQGIETTLTKSQIKGIATMTEGWSGSDLESLTREAAMAPVRECIRSAARLRKTLQENQDLLLQEFQNLRPVSFQDFEQAVTFWNANHNPNNFNAAATYFDSSGPDSTSGGNSHHYDSSSDEEEEEDD